MKAALGMDMTRVVMTDASITNILSLTDQDKRRLRRDVLAEYSAWVDSVCEECENKVEFTPEEIVAKIVDITVGHLDKYGFSKE